MLRIAADIGGNSCGPLSATRALRCTGMDGATLQAKDSFANTHTKTPPELIPTAFASLGRSGDRSPCKEDQPMLMPCVCGRIAASDTQRSTSLQCSVGKRYFALREMVFIAMP
jgi:hypothetical protein